MLLEKYEPKSTKEIIGNYMQISAIKDFIKNWRKGTAMFLCGPTGVGKTLAIRLIAKELNYQLIESHADDDRTAKAQNDLVSSSKQQSIAYSKKLFLIDEIEQIESTRMLTELITKSEFPIIIIGEDPYIKKFSSLRKLFKIIKFQKPQTSEISKFIENLCRRENIALETKDINQLARMCNGDMRAALIDIEVLKILGAGNLHGVGHREQIYDIFNLLRIVFKSASIGTIKTVSDNIEDPEKLFLWIDHNIANEFSDIKEIASAYDYLSKADVFRARIIKRQSWSLQKYYYNLQIFGMIPNKKTNNFTKYEPPAFFYTKRIGDTLEKIADRTHTSKKKSMEYVRLIRALMKQSKQRKELIDNFEFDENDAEILAR